MFFISTQKVTIQFGYFLKILCHEKLQKNHSIWSHWTRPKNRPKSTSPDWKKGLQYCHDGLDQMVRLIFNIWPFATMKISPKILSQIRQSRLSHLLNKK